MPVAPGAFNGSGNLHGGAIATLVDVASGSAAARAGTFRPGENTLVTADLHVRYLGRPKGTVVRAEARVMRAGRQLIVVECRVADDLGNLIAFADFAGMIVPLRQPLRGRGRAPPATRTSPTCSASIRASLTGPRQVWYVRPPFQNNRERAMEIFHRVGLSGAFRIAHVIVAMMWMGLLWFFNFVQTPAYAEMEAGSRNDAFDKLTWRALWWFRWSAAATVLFGLLIIAIAPKGTLRQGLLGPQRRRARRSRSASCSASRCSSTCGSSSGRTSRS